MHLCGRGSRNNGRQDGPQLGFIFPVGEMQGYLNFKGYKEFAAENRPDGWNTWVTFVISPGATPSAPRRMVTETVIAGPSSQRVGFRPNFDESGDVFLSKECDFGYDCVFARDKMGFIGKPDHIGGPCFESGWDRFACTTLACSAHAHHSQKLNLKYVFVMIIPHHSRPH